MIDAVDVMAIDQRKLRHYMENYLSMMMCICSVFLRMRNTPEDERKRDEIWSYLKNADAALYRRVRTNALNLLDERADRDGPSGGFGRLSSRPEDLPSSTDVLRAGFSRLATFCAQVDGRLHREHAGSRLERLFGSRWGIAPGRRLPER